MSKGPGVVQAGGEAPRRCAGAAAAAAASRAAASLQPRLQPADGPTRHAVWLLAARAAVRSVCGPRLWRPRHPSVSRACAVPPLVSPSSPPLNRPHLPSHLPIHLCLSRVMLKVSGEALEGKQGFGIDPQVLQVGRRWVSLSCWWIPRAPARWLWWKPLAGLSCRQLAAARSHASMQPACSCAEAQPALTALRRHPTLPMPADHC